MFMRISITAVALTQLVVAQSPSDNNTHHTLASFVFIRTGERTPILRNDTQILTALGAQQMYTLGLDFRTRYIAGDSPRRLGVERITEISVDTIDNDQIWVQTLDKPYLVSSAQAFMQGLYPPHSISNGTEKVTNLLADGTYIDYPLNGYQYASIQATSPEDPDSRYISGSQNCPLAQVASLEYFTTEEFQETETANADLFKKLNLEWLEGTLPEAYFNARSALEIADYVSYQYVHNSSVYKVLSANGSDYTGVYGQLGHLADEVAWYLYGNTSDLSSDTNNQAIGGKTLASSILSLFRLRIADRTSSSDEKSLSYPLTFYFGEEDAMMGLVSLLKLDALSPQFKSIPSYGSAMIFELFSTNDGASPPPTSRDDLWVRFSFHNATDADADHLIAYPMFKNGPSKTEMQWSEFESLVSNMAVGGIAEWCSTCNSASLFCRGAVGKKTGANSPPPLTADPKGTSRLSPIVGGVIGAVVSLVAAAVVFALVMLLGGIRFHRVERRNIINNNINSNNKRAGLGGFKGSAKLASDADLSLTNDGVAGVVVVGAGGTAKRGHERVGSWELRQKDFGGKINDVSPRESFEGIDSVVAGRRVEPLERV